MLPQESIILGTFWDISFRPSNFYSIITLGNLIFALIASAGSSFNSSCIPVWYHCLQTSSEKDTEQQQGQEQTQLKGKVEQLQDELEVTDQQITALNPLLHLDTLRQRCEQWSLTTIIILILCFVCGSGGVCLLAVDSNNRGFVSNTC